MAISSAFDRTAHLSELNEPLDTQAGVLSPAQRRALLRVNAGLTGLATVTMEVPAQSGKVGATAGWAPAGANNLPLATLPASQTNSTLVIPIPLPVGATLSSVAVIGQVESAGNAVTMTLDVRKVTVAASDFADASIANDTLGAGVTADTILSSANLGVSGLSEVISTAEMVYALITGTTLASTDVGISNLQVTYNMPSL